MTQAMTILVKVKVGQEQFEIDIAKVKAYPDTTIAAAVRFNKNHELDFSYRDPTLFNVVLTLYNSGKLTVPKDVTYSSLKEELSFWGFELAVPIVRTNQQFTLFDTQPSTSLACPWGLYARNLGNACWMPVACFVWSIILANPLLIETAALGYNDITIYIKHSAGEDGTAVSMLLSHKHFLQRLGELSACTVRFIDGVYGQDVHREARTQDLHTSTNPMVRDWSFVHEKEIAIQCSMSMGTVSLSAPVPASVDFAWKGYSVHIDFDGTTMFWECNCADADKEDPIYLQDLSGFLLRVSFVINNSILEGFIIPSTRKRYFQVNIPHIKCNGFVVPPDTPKWYKDTSKLRSTGMGVTPANLKQVSSVLVLVEEAARGVLDLNHIDLNLDVPYGGWYERLNICF
jgi:hypothetical protein